jgi:D-cysteine desulfhydrase
MGLYPIFDRLPSLRSRAPVAGLLPGITPITPLADAPGLYLKRDDLSAPDYGGNKIRKLDFLLAAAQARGTREIVCFGYAGSNFVAATAWHAHKLGMQTCGFLLPQEPASYVADNLAVSLAVGAELRELPSMRAIGLAATLRSLRGLAHHRRWPWWIPPGGSSPVGVLGFINGALELQQQIAAGELAVPDVIYVAFSSMGTVAGLAIGLALAGLPTRIVAIQVVDDRFASPGKLDALLRRTLRLLGTDTQLPPADQLLQRISIRTEFFGQAYARPTAATKHAIDRFQRSSGARADSAYTGKGLAGLYNDLDAGHLKGQTVVYWHSFNAHGRPSGVALPRRSEVPAALQHYFAD